MEKNKAPRYIDTNEIIRIYKRWIEQLQLPEDEGALEGVQTCLDVLLEQPIVDVAPVVHGRWDGNGNCSVCNKNIYKDMDADIWATYEPPCCPNCGAKMDLEE